MSSNFEAEMLERVLSYHLSLVEHPNFLTGFTPDTNIRCFAGKVVRRISPTQPKSTTHAPNNHPVLESLPD